MKLRLEAGNYKDVFDPCKYVVFLVVLLLSCFLEVVCWRPMQSVIKKKLNTSYSGFSSINLLKDTVFRFPTYPEWYYKVFKSFFCHAYKYRWRSRRCIGPPGLHSYMKMLVFSKSRLMFSLKKSRYSLTQTAVGNFRSIKQVINLIERLTYPLCTWAT